MAKKVEGYIKLQIPAGKATPAPPVGPARGQHGVNIVEFTKQMCIRDRSLLAESTAPEREFSCVTFNNLGYNLEMEVPAPAQSVRENDACIQKGGTRNVWEYYGIPYLNILMDHPFHYEKPLRLAPETSVVLCTCLLYTSGLIIVRSFCESRSRILQIQESVFLRREHFKMLSRCWMNMDGSVLMTEFLSTVC